MKKILIFAISLCAILLAGCTNLFIDKEKENKNTEEKKMATKIEFIRNATMKITYGGKTFLTDPLLADKASLNGFLYRDQLVNPTVEMSMSKEEVLTGIDGIVVTHTHIPAEDVPSPASDHFDPVAIESIAKDSKIFVQPSDKLGLNRLGFIDVTAVETTTNWDDIKITRIIGKHVDIDALLPMIGESSGYVLESKDHPTIFWTGDSLLTDEIKDAVSEYNPDIIITHSGKAQLSIDAEGNKATLLMGAEETVEIAKLAPNAKIVAIHMEALDHCTVSREDLKTAFAETEIAEDRYMIPLEGEVLEF